MNGTSKRQLISAILMALALASPMAFAATPAPAPVSWLFVEEAGGGTLTGPDDQHLTLTLTRLRNYVTAFADRPIRSTTAYPNAMFFQKYPKMFAGDPPNAVLSYSKAHSIQPTSLVLTLSNPRYDAKLKTVKYDAVRVKGTAKAQYQGKPYTADTVHALKTPKVFGQAALFIDGVGAYQIGDTGPAGGKVFYLTDVTGKHGLEAAPKDQSSGFEWGCAGTTVDGTSTAYGTGNANTAAINAVCGTGTAAAIAASYSLNGFSDWYLPSKDELKLLYAKKKVVGGFASNFYWSSSEGGSSTAWAQYFSYGYQYSYAKEANLNMRVRAVRAF